MSRKADVHAPIASARDRMAAAEVTLFFLSWRHPKTASARSESSHGASRMSRLSSRSRSAEPNARRAPAGSRPCSIASSMCEESSSSISRLKRSPRNTLTKRDHNDISDRPQDSIYGRCHGLPARLFCGKLLLARRGQLIDACPPSALFGNPFGADPAGFLHAVQRGIERTFLGAQDFAGPVLDRRHDGVAVQARPPR